MINGCLEAVTDVAFSDKRHATSISSLSGFTAGRRSQKISSNTEGSLKNKSC
jgi:hypothetical protein